MKAFFIAANRCYNNRYVLSRVFNRNGSCKIIQMIRLLFHFVSRNDRVIAGSVIAGEAKQSLNYEFGKLLKKQKNAFFVTQRCFFAFLSIVIVK